MVEPMPTMPVGRADTILNDVSLRLNIHKDCRDEHYTKFRIAARALRKLHGPDRNTYRFTGNAYLEIAIF